MNEIGERMKAQEERIKKAQAEIKRARAEISLIQTLDCPHADRERWTNNDGDGQFVVEKCRDCGLQKDGGLGGK